MIEGDENLDNDRAQDMLIQISQHLCARIRFLLNFPDGHEYDSPAIAELFVAIEILFALADAGLTSVRMEPTELERETDAFLGRWEACHQKNGHAASSVRKASMIATFTRLKGLAKRFEQDKIQFHKCGDTELTPVDRTVLDILNGQ